MEALYVNQIVFSETMFYKYYRITRKPITYMCMAWGFIFLIRFILSIITNPSIRSLLPAILSVYLFIFPMLTHKINAKRLFEQQKLITNSSNPHATYEFGERIHSISSNKGESYLDYSQITRMYETKDYFILILAKKISIILVKNSFSVGNIADFRHFIQTRCPSVSINYTLRF